MAHADDDANTPASPACWLHEAPQDYVDPKWSAAEIDEHLGRIVTMLRGIVATAARALIETDHPGLMTVFERSGRVAARNLALLQPWAARSLPAPVPDLEPDLERRAEAIEAAENRLLQALDELSPRVANDPLHAELIKVRDLYLYVRSQPEPIII